MLAKTGRKTTFRGSVEKYAEMMESLDHNVGRILAAHKNQGLDQDTVVVFTSDNGGERFSDTWPLIGYKAELLEGGMRVPFLVKWPGHIPASSKIAQVISLIDVVPTLQAVAGTSGGTWYGVNILPQLEGRASNFSRTLFWRFNAQSQEAVRDGDWKYVRLNGKEGLFNLRLDPRERTDLKAERPKMAKSMHEAWEAWNAQMLPYTSDDYAGSTYTEYVDRY